MFKEEVSTVELGDDEVIELRQAIPAIGRARRAPPGAGRPAGDRGATP
jgi:hypothetical protein